jgi:hypothetical protein
LRVNWLESTVFLNRGQHFEARVLPVEAQLAPAFGVCVADFDGDGAQDVFVAQNFFAGLPETPRHDGGLGLLLIGDGHGGFRALKPAESGLHIPGEQRGAATCDFDGDGRADIAVAQNGAPTRLYRNNGTGRAALRIHLRGPQLNPQGLGAVVQLIAGDIKGAATEIHGGSGYWSYDSTTSLPTSRGVPSSIAVRWPGGKQTTANLPTGATDVQVDFNGASIRK